VGLAQNLGIRLIAEGIETADQLVMLQALECELAQGITSAGRWMCGGGGVLEETVGGDGGGVRSGRRGFIPIFSGERGTSARERSRSRLGMATTGGCPLGAGSGSGAPQIMWVRVDYRGGQPERLYSERQVRRMAAVCVFEDRRWSGCIPLTYARAGV